MAAPDQHALTNTCTFPASSAAFSSTAGSYDSGQTALCSHLHGRVSVANDRYVPSVVCSSATPVSQPSLANSASRKIKPCSLCGTAALRSQSSLVPNSPLSPQEQPVVLLHRLEDGLPEGDVDSLRAFGTIRLLPIHRLSGEVDGATDDSKHECDRKYQSVASHNTAPENLTYKSFKRENIKNRTELPGGDRSYGDPNESMTNEIIRKYKGSDDHHTLRETRNDKTVKKNTDSGKFEVGSGGTSHRAKKRSETRVCDNSARSRLYPGEKTFGARLREVSSRHNYPSQYSTGSLDFYVTSASESSHLVPSSHHQTFSSSQAETLDHSATDSSHLSPLNRLSSPQRSTSSTTNIHLYGSNSPSCSTQDTLHPRSTSPDTSMSVMCSPVVPFTTTSLSSPSQSLGSPPAISPPESPPTPPSPFSLPFMCSPSRSGRENLHPSCSGDVQPPSSPYSPCTLPSLPASPASLPSSSESPPSPAPSVDSPPASPSTSAGQESEISYNQAPLMCSERLGCDPPADLTDSAASLDTVLKSEIEFEQSKIGDDKTLPECRLNRESSVENVEELLNKSCIDRRDVTQVPSASQLVGAPSTQIHMSEDTSTVSQNSETEAQADSCQEISVYRECGDGVKNVAEEGYSKPGFAKCFLNQESKSVEVEKNCNDSRNSLMKLVLKVKHPGNQQLPLVPEKNEYNKENGIPKIVLTLRGKGPNKEYSCSNRLRNESESCSGENMNNKKHKSKKNKRLKPKEKEKVKKVMKGGKHKRHVELFGEDSNDSCDIIRDSFKVHTNQGRHSRTPSIDEQELQSSLPPSTTEESSPVHGDKDLPPTLSPSEPPSDCAKDCESEGTMESPHSPVDELVLHPLPSLTSVVSEMNTVLGAGTEVRSSVEESEEVNETQTKSTENNTQETIKLTMEVPDACDAELPCLESKQEEGTSVASPGRLHCSEINHQDKQPEGQILRSRRSRQAKNTESGRNSDSCLWVSFGMNAPVPLPAIDLPHLEPVFTSTQKTRFKETETNKSKKHIPLNESVVEADEEHVQKVTHKEGKEEEKTGVMTDIKESIKTAKSSDCKTDPFYTRYSHEEDTSTHGRTCSQGDPTHHGTGHSHTRSRKSDYCREQVVKKEVDSCHYNPLDAKDTDENGSQKMNTNIYQENSTPLDLTRVCAPVDVQMETEDEPDAKDPLAFPDVSLGVDDEADGHKEPSNEIFQAEEKVTPNEVTIKPEGPGNMIEEINYDNYYRHKVIRRTCNSNISTAHWNEKKYLDQSEDWKAQISGTVEESKISHKDCVSPKLPSPESVTTTSSSEIPTGESESSRVECDISEVKPDAYWKPHAQIITREVHPIDSHDSDTSNQQRKRKCRSSTPEEPERVIKMDQDAFNDPSKDATEGVKEETTEKEEDVGKGCHPGKEDNEKQDVSKKEKEKWKKSRRKRKKYNLERGSRCSVLQQTQVRRKKEHEEGRGQRLAQEIKGFNWLEQKIKNRSLLSSQPIPSTPTASPSAKECGGPSSRTSTPTASPSIHFTFDKKDEQPRKITLSGSSSCTGFKRHLQTAVPPLVPSSKVTALPKRRQSQGTPTTPPCATPSPLCSAAAVPSMTVHDVLNTCEPNHYRSDLGKDASTLEKSSTGFANEHYESDKATLYSSTSSTKATLYAVKDNSFEALYDTVSANTVNYYSNARSGNSDTQYNIAASPTISFYGSKKYQGPNFHPNKTLSTGPNLNCSLTSTSRDSSASTDYQLDAVHSGKPDTSSSTNSDWSPRQESNPNSNHQHSSQSSDSHNPQRFSHKQALLRRAFQEMLKSEPDNSSSEQAKENQCVMQTISSKTEMSKADESKCKRTEAASLTTSQLASGRTSPGHITSLKVQCPDTPPTSLSNNILPETTDSRLFSYSQKCVASPLKSEEQFIKVIHGSKMSTDTSEDAENVTYKLDSNDKIMKSESDPDIKENCSDLGTSKQEVNDDIDVKFTENSIKDLQSNVIDCIVSASADINIKVLKDEICYKDDDKKKEDAEVQPNMLLSVLYKELMKTRQEVEKLRKVQELMLTEKGEKKEDATEQSSEIEMECEKTDENSPSNERILGKRKDHEINDDTELKIYDECYYHENKKSKISIRSDLLPADDNIALDAITSDTSTSQVNLSHVHQSSSPALSNPSSLEISVTTLEGSPAPNTSHPSRGSPAIPPVSPELSSSIPVPPKMSSSMSIGNMRTSPGVSSPGIYNISRTSPVILKSSPSVTRASPGTPQSNSESTIASPGISVSPAMPSSSPGIPKNSPGTSRNSPGAPRNSPGAPRNSPGAPKNSPGAPRNSPGVIRMSPGLPRINYGLPKAIPGIPMVSSGPSRNGQGLMRNGSELHMINPGIPALSPTSTQGNIFNPPSNPSSTENLQLPCSHSAVTTVHPKMITSHSITSPLVTIPRFPHTPITSTAVPMITSTGGITNCPLSRISPNISKNDATPTVSLNKTATPLTNMSPTRLRTVFGISNSEVELMPVSAEAKQPLQEPQPQTFLKLVEDQYNPTTETPVRLNVVDEARQESGSKDAASSSSHGQVPFHNVGYHEDPKRISETHQYIREMKRQTFSTSDLPDHASSCKQPPPLKPVPALLRRHSDNLDIHSVMHYQPLYPGTRKNLAGSLHPSTSSAELKNPNTMHPFNQPHYAPTQYSLPNPGRRRNIENNTLERNRGFQQAVSMGLQQQFPHLASGPAVMRSLGPDKATIFPLPPSIPTGIRHFRAASPPPVSRAQLEQFQNENFYRSNFSFFEKIREKCAHSYDNGINAIDRLQSSTTNVEKTLQPQTFAPRVLVRESIPETSPHIPSTTFTTLHFPNPNQPSLSNIATHQNHFPPNMDSGSNIHPMAQGRLHTSTNQATSSSQRNRLSGRSGEKLCFHCPQQARFICSGCKKACYCSEQCQRDHWSVHSDACVL